ncbi:hypothetical protein [Neobacillus drentensis]|uniref:hypothetical protein n=1 Tax=Neobacillus drentensis TaxID=220684 RepID=UPI000826C11A|nr:hypothetical protein [Neobacillus drentensis]
MLKKNLHKIAKTRLLPGLFLFIFGDYKCNFVKISKFAGSIGELSGPIGGFTGSIGELSGPIGGFAGSIGGFPGSIGELLGSIGGFAGSIGESPNPCANLIPPSPSQQFLTICGLFHPSAGNTY